MAENAVTEPVRERRSQLLSVRQLLRGDSPRADGEVPEHIQQLAESSVAFPAILVHRPSMRVIDGMHRLQAALLRGDELIAVEFFDGDEDEAFVAAVRANITHGLPLTRDDREAAAERLVGMYPGRSDRWIAEVAGLAPATIATIRGRLAADNNGHEPAARIGRDGKVRPLNSARARQIARDVITERPEASLREVARLSGLSPATVRDVRDRVRRGDDPVPERERSRRQRAIKVRGHYPDRDAGKLSEAREPETLIQILRSDPKLKFSDSGRSLLSWLSGYGRGFLDRTELIESVPPHCAFLVAELAVSYARQWYALAGRLEQRLNDLA